MTEAQLLDGQAFNRLVLENDLVGKTWEQNGYVYAGFKGVAGYELYRAYGPRWMYLFQSRRVITQNAVGGGALRCVITVAAGVEFKLLRMYAQGPASNTTLSIGIYDEDTALVTRVANIAAGVSRDVHLPQTSSGSSTSGKEADTSMGILLGPGERMLVDAAAALQTETLTVAVVGLLPLNATADSITFATTGSAGTPAIAASTISAANTLQAVLLPCP